MSSRLRYERAHPRSRGENLELVEHLLHEGGSSPLTRGKRLAAHPVLMRHRLIPAHAGKTSRVFFSSQCGRLIPAHAGKTNAAAASCCVLRAHPRSRGENASAIGIDRLIIGSSPLTRGKHAHQARAHAQRRLIPAHAGKTCMPRSLHPQRSAHPRSRGENVRSTSAWHGLLRLIPAHAGKTVLHEEGLAAAWAHPRSRGENELLKLLFAQGLGSSPLTRGKRCPRQRHGMPTGLIPAHAGKTLPDLRFYCADRSDLGNP